MGVCTGVYVFEPPPRCTPYNGYMVSWYTSAAEREQGVAAPKRGPRTLAQMAAEENTVAPTPPHITTMTDRADCIKCCPTSPLVCAGNSYFTCAVCIRTAPAAPVATRPDAIPMWITTHYPEKPVAES